jgi:hypothetical protein
VKLNGAYPLPWWGLQASAVFQNQLGGVRLQGMFDVYNIFNENSVLTRNNTFGATWGRPTRILGARLIKFGAQIDF